MGDLMDSRADGLYLAHALPQRDALRISVKEAVHLLRYLLNRNGNRRRALQGLHENLILLHIPGKVGNQLRQGVPDRL